MLNDRGLRQVFPQHVARRLKNGEAVAAEAHENVTILFCDIVGFTGMSSSVGPFLCPLRAPLSDSV